VDHLRVATSSAPVIVSALATGSAPVIGSAPASGPGAQPLAADDARAQLKALADPIRLQLIESLASGERCVCELTAELGLAQSKLSFHLKVLKQAGLLADRQSGRWVYYRLRSESIEALSSWLASLAAQSSTPAEPCR
jgi:ArsR family transcriptional regulator